MISFSDILHGCRKNKRLLTISLLLWANTCFSQLYTDISLQHQSTPALAEVGDTLTFSIQLFNEGATNLTELSVRQELPASVAYLDHTIPLNTTYDPVSGIWDIGDAMTQFTGFMQMEIRVIALVEGTVNLIAQVQTMNEVDVDSAPGNDNFLEDDMAGACVSIPYHICGVNGESVTMEAPAGYASYEWFHFDGNGTVLVSTDPVFTASEPGYYTYVVGGSACASGSCCPIILESSCNINQPPVANSDFGETDENTPIDISILDNDFDPDGELDTNSVTVVDPPSNGTVTVNPDGTITYTPNGGFSGIDTVIYEVCDNGIPAPVLCDTSIVIVTVGDLFFDLSLEKVLAPGQPGLVDIGDEVVFRIVVYNEGNVPATNISLVDLIPPGMSLSPNDPNWVVNSNGNAGYLITEILKPGDSTYIDITMIIDYGGGGDLLTNWAEITGQENPSGFTDVDVDSTPNNGDDEEDDQDGADVQLIPHDPTGYIYCEKTGKIITGGTIQVDGPGEVFIISDGSSGYYEFYTDGTPGTYTLSYSHPDGYPLSETCLPQPDPIDPTGMADPVVLGSDTTGVYLTDIDCAANPYYLTFDLEPGDPFINNNNLPLQCAYIGSTVCLDEGNDLIDGNEPGFEGITVHLYNCNDTLNPISTTTVDADGQYEFDCLTAGEYIVQFVLPSGYRFIQNSGFSAGGFSDCTVLDFGECDTTITTCIYPCPVVDAGMDVALCAGEAVQFMASVPYGTGSFSWTPEDYLSNAGIQDPLATPEMSMVYTVEYDDGLGCASMDSLVVMIDNNCGDDLINEDSVTISTNCDLGDPLFCFDVPYSELANFSFELNGEPYEAEFGTCEYLKGSNYTYGNIFTSANSGPYELEYWNVNGVVYNAGFEDMDELVDLMNTWDPLGEWVHNESTRSIVGGFRQTFYSALIIRDLNSGTVTTLNLHRFFIPNSSYVIVPEGEHTLVVTRNDGVTDTVYIKAACVTPEYVEIVMPVGASDTICLSTEELEEDVVAIFDQCLAGFDEPADLGLIPGTNCIEVFGMYPGETESCYVICDELGICDTTYIHITVYNDEFSLFPDSLCTPKNVSIVGEVLLNDHVPGNVVSLTILDPPNHGSVVVNPDNTVTYIPDEDYCNDDEDEPLDVFTYEVCTPFECLNTTVYVQVKCDGLIVYNGFSPNGDGINEFFKIDGLQAFENHKLMVFNRWGLKVFQSENYRNDWDGYWDDKRLPIGTYFYLIELNDGERWVSGYLQIWW